MQINVLIVSNGVPVALEGCEVDVVPRVRAPSLVTLVRNMDADTVIVDQTQGFNYSLPHIITAARTAAENGKRLILAGKYVGPNEHKAFLGVTDSMDMENLAALLAQPVVQPIPLIPKPEPAQKPEAPSQPETEKKETASDPPEPELPRRINVAGDMPRICTVASTQSRIGGTAQAIQMYHYFSIVGYNAAITMTKYMDSVKEAVDTRKTADGIIYMENVPFVPSNNCPGYDCYVEETGVLNEDTVGKFERGDFRVLVGGVGPTEIKNTTSALSFLAGRNIKPILILSFAGEDGAREFKEIMAAKNWTDIPVIAAPWQPGLFRENVTKEYYQTLNPVVEQMAEENVNTLEV